MKSEPDSNAFLFQAYRVAKLIAVSSVSLVAFIISLVALDVSKGHWWVDIKIPLFATVLTILFIIIVFSIFAISLSLILKQTLDSRSFYRNEARGLKSLVSNLTDLAFNDSITGIPNSNKLKLVIRDMLFDKPRCLILLDLKNFGLINKRHNHWVGDEYLRRFAQLVADSGRRNEYLFKSRPLEDTKEKDLPTTKDEVKAFRKNSGGDEFFMLIEGSVIDALGYLNRLMKRAPEFEKMALDVIGENHPFGFCAGVVSIAVNESYESVTKRVSHCLGLTLEDESKMVVYWIKSELPTNLTSFQKSILAETEAQFKK